MKLINVICLFVFVTALMFSPLSSSAHAQGTCAGDNNGDGLVNSFDLAIVLGAWGVCPGTITSVTPLHGSILGGTQITINGTNLAGTTAVKIGGVACTNLQVLSPTLVKAVTPAGTAGEFALTVITAAGTLFSPAPFTYVQLSISSVSPNQGIFSGGTAITITGSFLNGATSVKVGGVPATDVVAVNSTTVTAVTPAGSVGAASIEVTGSKGTATASGAFTYIFIIVPAWATLLEATPNPAVVTDANLRAAIVASGFAWRVRDNASNIEMLLVPSGTFTMGCSASTSSGCYSDETPLHQVTLSAFYMGRYEVTQAQWLGVMGSNPSYFVSASGYSSDTTKPVERVSWYMIQDFNSVTGLRLLTEAEWEYAYRAGTTTAFHSYPAQPTGFNNNAFVGNISWYSNAGNQTHAVGGKFANALGLHDMSGNVWEWCQDWYGLYSSGSVTNPTGPGTGKSRLLRGGAWDVYSNGGGRASDRDGKTPDYTGYSGGTAYTVGFRVARNP